MKSADDLSPHRYRIVVLAPTGKDAAITTALLTEAAMDSVVCPDLGHLAQALEPGAGALLIAEEAINAEGWRALTETLSQQPPWSDLPVLLLARYGADSQVVREALQRLSNVTLLERPVRPTTLLSSLKAALRARERQYQCGNYLEAQQRANQELAESIRERERVEAALRDADRRKDEFLATLAHELRNPLAPIRNSLHLLQLTCGNDPALTQTSEMIERQVGHLVRLVDDLMEVSRITRGKVELKKLPVELAAVIRTAVEATRPLIDQLGHQLAISLPVEPIVIDADSVRLSQVVANLLNNSAKYMDRGGQIWLSVKLRQDQVVISVRDSGVGIDAATLPHIFEMFTQADRSKRQAQGGLGIGLTLVKSLVEMHGGQISAESAGLDQGSEFLIRLPYTKATRSTSSASSGGPSLERLPNLRVLIVDDNRDAANSLGEILRLLGMEVRTVHDGRSALKMLPQFVPQVMLLDIGMPEMNGYEIAREIRQQPQWRELTLVALTGWGQEEDRRLSKEAGFDHHLLKPADLGTLRALFTSTSEKPADGP